MPPGALTLFQFPNFKPDKPDNLRQIAVVGALDLALLRADAGSIVRSPTRCSPMASLRTG
jgi:hypothetical protein